MEKPILFNTEMVKAILDGKKTCTRRILKRPFEVHPNGFITKAKGDERLIPYESPYKVGDILYVRETWNFLNCVECDGDAGNGCIEMPVNYKGNRGCFAYKVNSVVDIDLWKPSIHMPKKAARIFLKVKEVKVERLQDITEEEALAEGFISIAKLNEDGSDYTGLYARENFQELWNSTLKKEQLKDYGWDANPYVWVIQFERCKKPDE